MAASKAWKHTSAHGVIRSCSGLDFYREIVPRPGSLWPDVPQDRQNLHQDLLGAIWELNARAGEREGR